LYLTPTKSHWACDIEADELLDKATRIWCVCVLNLETKEEQEFTDAESFQTFIEQHDDAILVGHNFIGYDLPMLNRFWGTRLGASRVVDTFILSQLYNPSYKRPNGCPKNVGPHSLQAWGLRLRYPKSSYEDFSAFSPEMLRYCRRDTRLTGLLFRRLSERMRDVGFSERGVELEHRAWNIIQNKQRRNGFPFDYQRAMELYVTLRAKEEELQDEIYKLWPPYLGIVKQFARGRVKSGAYSKNYLRHKAQYPRLEWTGIGSGYVAYDFITFNLGSPSQRVEKLLSLGWVPTQFTPKTDKGGGGNPRVDEESLLEFAEFSGKKELIALAKWIVVNSRANMINTWMEAYNEQTGSIHGKLFIASTLRYKHSAPNSANIPAVRLKKDDEGVERIQYGEDGGYSYEARDLWTCGNPTEFSLVGIDGTGIQNRCLVHGLIKTVGEDRVREFKELALEGDIHKRNIEVLGLANKAAAKKFYYTLMMGGQGARLAADQAQFGTKMTAKEGTEKRKAMIASIPGFGELIKELERELQRTGRIRLCDGTPILVPSPHMVIPYLLQGDESRLMKQALVYVDEEINRQRLRGHVFKVADIHDEWQWKVRKKYVEQFIALALPCFPRAGESFDYNIPITGDAKEGLTWAETH
jgi:DNA polymerase-1